MDKYGKRFGINWLFTKLDIYPNGYYNYKKHRKNAKKKRKAAILKKIGQIYHEASGKPGYRMMQKLLENEGIYLSKGTVHKYMNVDLGLKSVTRRKRNNYTTGPVPHKVFENLIKQNFCANARNKKWCIDFTYLRLPGGKKRYNCSIIDLYDRRVVASVNGSQIDTELAIETVREAIKRSGGEVCEILHSDRGSQFTSKDFTEFCKSYDIKQSMSKPGYPYDNAPMERYFNSLKSEMIYLRTFKNEDELYMAVNAYAYGWYNNVRPHTYNGGIAPAKVA